MIVEIKVPSPGESINEVQIASWLVEDGETVDKDQDIVEIDSDKATLPLASPEDGKITILVEEGETIGIGTVIATVDTEQKGKKKKVPSQEKAEEKAAGDKQPAEKPVAEKPAEEKETAKTEPQPEKSEMDLIVSPLARKLMESRNISGQDLVEFFKQYRISKQDVEFYIKQKDKASAATASPVASAYWTGERTSEVKKMSMLRKKLAQRLVSVKNETAMLTTFNEVNMTPIMNIRARYKEIFKEQHGVGLGFMSFFTKAVTEAIAYFPQINSQLDGDEVVFFNYVDISIAVSGPKGLVVPVIRNAEMLSLAEIEAKVKELAVKARENRITLEEMQGGTFTITNGGVFGSMLSTPIINPPQSAILGMHNIVERPVAVNGKVEIHPVMYVALSYDHRLVDGKESVSFLVKVKEMLENPERMLFGGKDGIEVLLGL
ncbi:MAG: 2-oxoglutarate dehydrogenase complex dihydrolipoyllysine-residue succinyltransferase [Chlorobi bacterium]|nr:2-oxoglutarate dehydrogenase complex dihydrolipoyllysine-residue succinyltransferase [Chlorobiota bacterium]